jgi:hypothetical protein
MNIFNHARAPAPGPDRRAPHFTMSVVALLTLASCTAPGPLFLRAPAGPPRDNGYIMFSITATGPADTAKDLCLSLHLRGISNAVAKEVSSCMTERLLPGNLIGKIVLIELPAGEYEFDAYGGAEASSNDAARYSSPPGFEYEFGVASATINYLGDLNFLLKPQIGYQQIGSGNFTPTHTLGMHFQVLDRQNRDTPLFDTQYPAYRQIEKLSCGGCALRNP